MAAPQNFRTAFNGFNREDVVHYIEYLNARHEAQINQLNAELDLLKVRAVPTPEDPELRSQLDNALAACEELKAQLVQRDETIRQLEAQADLVPIQAPDPQPDATFAQLEAQLRASEEECMQLKGELAAVRVCTAQLQVSQELEAYRRAERTERIARERAEQVYRQANGALADATVKVDEAFSQLSGLADRVSDQLAQLQQAVSGSRQALADATETLYAIRPETEIN